MAPESDNQADNMRLNITTRTTWSVMIHENRGTVSYSILWCHPSSIFHKRPKYWLGQGKVQKKIPKEKINNEHCGSLRVNDHRSSTEPKQSLRANIILLSWVTEDHGYHSHNLHEYLFLCGRMQKKIIFRGCWSKWISLACSVPSLPLVTGLWAVTYGESERTWPHSASAVLVCCFNTEKRWAGQSHLPKWHYPSP